MNIFAITLISALLASLASAIGGLGGGLILYFSLASFYSLSFVIPIHGLGMLSSNFFRLFYLKDQIKKVFLIPFLLGLPFGVLLAIFTVTLIQPTAISIILLTLITYSLFKPKKMPELRPLSRHFYFIGFIAGYLAIVLGATGSFIKPFFNRSDLTKEEIVANESTLQFLTHLIKIPAFIYLGFNYEEHLVLILFLVLTTWIGTYVGLHVLRNISRPLFQIIFKGILFSAGLKITHSLLFSP